MYKLSDAEKRIAVTTLRNVVVQAWPKPSSVAEAVSVTHQKDTEVLMYLTWLLDTELNKLEPKEQAPRKDL